MTPEEAEFYRWIIYGLVAAIVSMAGYFVHITAKHSKEKDALIKIVVESAMKMTVSLDNNTKTLDRLADKL